MASLDYVQPEDFGTPGMGPNDNALFEDAVATGKTVLAFGPFYRLDQLEFTVSPAIIFGPKTEWRNVQDSGTKKAAITVTGSLGASTTISALSTTAAGAFLKDRVTVGSAASFSVGDRVRIAENGPDLDQVYNPGIFQDANYWEFATIVNISGNIVDFEEFLTFGTSYDTAKSMTMTKVDFVERVRIEGGRYTGSNGSGGGVRLKYCRDSHLANISGGGYSDDDRDGGQAVSFEDCWECTSSGSRSEWSLFSFDARRNQSCIFSDIQGKRTSNGGVMSNGNIKCHFDILQDSPGDTNGDGLQVGNGSRKNTFRQRTSGSHCYTVWSHQYSDDNDYEIWTDAGITRGMQVFGNNNQIRLTAAGHGSNGLNILGNNNKAHGNVTCEATALTLAASTDGNEVTGHWESLGNGVASYDVLIDQNVTNSKIDITGGVKGVHFASRARPDISCDYHVKGPNPYHFGRSFRTLGYEWAQYIAGVSTTANDLMVPSETDGALVPLDGSLNSSSTAICYKISLVDNSRNVPNAWSEYLVTVRSGIVKAVLMQSGGAFQQTPLIEVNGNIAQILAGTGIIVKCLISKF